MCWLQTKEEICLHNKSIVLWLSSSLRFSSTIIFSSSYISFSFLSNSLIFLFNEICVNLSQVLTCLVMVFCLKNKKSDYKASLFENLMILFVYLSIISCISAVSSLCIFLLSEIIKSTVSIQYLFCIYLVYSM